MLGRMMVSALALTGVAYAQENTPTANPGGSDCATPVPESEPECAATPIASGADRVVYDAAFFSRFNPQHAADIVRQTPGFTLNDGDGRRGFSGAVGNLLIDGVRPSTKSQSLDGILSRIPANQVVRVELLRGAAIAGDASGAAVLLNVVRTPNAGSGLWNAGFEHFEGKTRPRGGASYSGRSGNIEYGVGASYYSQWRAQPGWRLFYDNTDTLTGTADTPSPREFNEGSINGNLSFPAFGGRLATTAQYYTWEFHSESDYLFADPIGAPNGELLSDYDESSEEYEVGLNFDREFGPWALEVVGLVNRRVFGNRDFYIENDPGGAFVGTLVQSQRRETGETIARAALSRALTPTQRIEFGAEGAFNSLDAGLQLITDDGSGPVVLTIPNSNVLVEEERADMFVAHTWRPNDHWSLESRLAWETSTLTFTGDANQVTELSFWKPSLQLTRSFSGNNQLRFRIYRDVGQLDFDDFVSNAAIADNIIAGGNPDLKPQTTWRAEVAADLRYGQAALELTLTRHFISDAADVVLVSAPGPNPGDPPILFDAPGNIGDGDATSLTINFSTPLTAIIPGGRLTINAELWDTEVTDPVTGLPRIMSYRSESDVSFDLRQDIASRHFAWGLDGRISGEYQAYRFNEIDTSQEGPWIDLWGEYSGLPNGMRLRVVLPNVGQGDIRRDRRFFTPDRTGAYSRLDHRQRYFSAEPWISVQLNGSF
ncbi:MAG: outer membrane beta-barrel protein [Hyphomonadaceae bacterium]